MDQPIAAVMAVSLPMIRPPIASVPSASTRWVTDREGQRHDDDDDTAKNSLIVAMADCAIGCAPIRSAPPARLRPGSHDVDAGEQHGDQGDLDAKLQLLVNLFD